MPNVLNTSNAVFLPIPSATSLAASAPLSFAVVLTKFLTPSLNKEKDLAPTGPISPSNTPSAPPLRNALVSLSPSDNSLIFSSSDILVLAYSAGIIIADIVAALVKAPATPPAPPVSPAATIIGAELATVLNPMFTASNIFPSDMLPIKSSL